ncbi:hypothetical protein KDA14_01735, partial [Candidatus Saccharibacteria bacterium]|nr:hypothetical protein [Candidatus Saccharibacteria bacterium]
TEQVLKIDRENRDMLNAPKRSWMLMQATMIGGKDYFMSPYDIPGLESAKSFVRIAPSRFITNPKTGTPMMSLFTKTALPAWTIISTCGGVIGKDSMPMSTDVTFKRNQHWTRSEIEIDVSFEANATAGGPAAPVTTATTALTIGSSKAAYVPFLGHLVDFNRSQSGEIMAEFYNAYKTFKTMGTGLGNAEFIVLRDDSGQYSVVVLRTTMLIPAGQEIVVESGESVHTEEGMDL